MPFSEYLDQQNEAMLSGMSARETTPVGMGDYDPLAGYRRIVAGRAAQEYSDAMAAQSDKEFMHQMIGTAVGSATGVLGGMGGFMAGQMGYNWMAGQMGWLEQQELYDRDDYITGNMAEATFMSAYRTMDPFSFGRRGMTGDQANEMAERLLPAMRGQGFDGMELTRMLPILEEQGALRPQGNFSSTEEALKEFETRISGFMERIGTIVRQTNMDIETATYFSSTETMLAGREGALGVGESGLMDTMVATSGATGLSYGDSLNLIRRDIAPWEHSTANLLPMSEAMASTYGMANLASTGGSWGTAWNRAGAQNVAGRYNQLGQRFFDANTTDLGRLYAGGGINRENMMALAAGEDIFEDLDPIDDINERYEAQYFARQELAGEPELMATAGMGQLVATMEGKDITSRFAQIEYMRGMGYDEDMATSLLNLHDQASTAGGRYGAYLGTQRTYMSNQGSRLETRIGTAIEHAQILSESTGTRTPWAPDSDMGALLRGTYAGYDQSNALMGMAGTDIRRTALGQDWLRGDISMGDVLISPGEIQGNRLSVLDLRTTLTSALAGENVNYNANDIITRALGNLRQGYEEDLASGGLNFQETVDRSRAMSRLDDMTGVMNMPDAFGMGNLLGMLDDPGLIAGLGGEIQGAWQDIHGDYMDIYSDANIRAVTPTTSAQIAGRNIVNRSTGALGGRFFGGTFDPQQLQDARQYQNALDGVTMLQRSPENMRNFASPMSPHQNRYQTFMENVQAKDISLHSVLGEMESEYGTVSSSNWENQTELRNRFAQQLYDGKDFLNLDEDQQGYIEEYIMTNDRTGAPGSGRQQWGGSHDNAMRGAEQEARERASELVNMEDMRHTTDIRRITTGVLSDDRYEGIESEDIQLYAQYTLGGMQLGGLERGSEEYNYIVEQRSRIEEQLGYDLSRVGVAYSDIGVRAGARGIQSDTLRGVLADPGGSSTYQLMSAALEEAGDAGLSDADQVMLHQALLKNDTNLIEGAEWVGGLGEETLLYQWSQDKLTTGEMASRLQGELPEGIARDLTIDPIEEVRSDFNRRVQTIEPVGGFMPVVVANLDEIGALTSIRRGMHYDEFGPTEDGGIGQERE